MVALARAPGPKRLPPACRPIASRTGPLTMIMRAAPPVLVAGPWSLNSGSPTALRAAPTTGKYSGRHPAITALIAACHAVTERSRTGSWSSTSSARQGPPASMRSTSGTVGGTTGRPSVQPSEKQTSTPCQGSSRSMPGWSAVRRLQIPRRPVDRAPHVGRRAVVPAEPFLGLAEVLLDDVGELLQLDFHARIERVEVVDREQARAHVPLVRARGLVRALDVRLGPVVRAEELDVRLRILVSDRLVGVEPERLVIADGPRDFRIDVGLHQLRRPVAVVAADEADVADVVQQAREHELLVQPVLPGEPRALEEMGGRPEAQLEEVEQGRLVGHPRKPRIVAHVERLALARRPGHRLPGIALPRDVDDGLHDDQTIQLFHLRALYRFGPFECIHGPNSRPRGRALSSRVCRLGRP